MQGSESQSVVTTRCFFFPHEIPRNEREEGITVDRRELDPEYQKSRTGPISCAVAGLLGLVDPSRTPAIILFKFSSTEDKIMTEKSLLTFRMEIILFRRGDCCVLPSTRNNFNYKIVFCLHYMFQLNIAIFRCLSIDKLLSA
jgi:hypothetical protein